jgi:Tol biopolymer transport system component
VAVVTIVRTGVVRFTVMKRILAIVACVAASVVASACGSSGAVHGPASIVFVAGAGVVGVGAGNTELVATTPGRGVRDLTSTSADSEYDASWSPDGSHVIFLRRPATRLGKDAAQEQAGIYVWTPGHGGPRQIASCSFYCRWYSFTWSPDNRQIAFVSERGNAAIKVMNADGSHLHTVCGVKRCGQGLDRPAWSPDGRRLVFDTTGFGGPATPGYIQPHAIWIANAGGSGARQLTQPNCNTPGGMVGRKARGCAVDYAPVWSPNGRLIAFGRSNAQLAWLPHATGPARPPSIEIMRADGSHLRTISTCTGSKDVGCYTYPPIAWAPDGKAIAYTYARVTTNHRASLRVTTLAGKTTTLRTCLAGSGCLFPQQLTWSPNGKQLAFMWRQRTTPSIWVIGRDGDGLHRVSRGGACCLAWVRNASLSG